MPVSSESLFFQILIQKIFVNYILVFITMKQENSIFFCYYKATSIQQTQQRNKGVLFLFNMWTHSFTVNQPNSFIYSKPAKLIHLQQTSQTHSFLLTMYVKICAQLTENTTCVPKNWYVVIWKFLFTKEGEADRNRWLAKMYITTTCH
jgi:hypothetical protein